jgi:polysaccharide biosynthesis transport protein
MLDEFEEKPSESKNWEHYWSLLQRNRWWLIVPTFLIWGLGWGGSWLLPAYYKSDTLILVEQQKVPEQYVVPNVATDIQERLQSMTQQILSRTRLLRIIDQFHLYANLRSRLSPDEIVDAMREDIQIDLVQAPGRREDLTAFKISYSARDPRLAQQVTNQLTSLFIDENLTARAQESESTTTFLQDQLDQAGKELSGQERRVREFKSKYLGQLPSQMESNVQIFSGLQVRLQAELEALNQSKQQNLYLESLLNQYRVMRSNLDKGDANKGLPPALDQELARLKTQLADVQAHYTERHPDYRKLKEQIAKVEKRKAQMANDLQSAPPPDTADDNDLHPADLNELNAMSPMLQVQSQLKANQLEIQNRQKLIGQLETQLEQYQARINQTPVREQQLSDLTRDYDQSRTNYDSLLAKRNQSGLATDLEKRQQGEQFRIIDPPMLPVKPYKPNRMLFSVIGLLAGAFVGFGALAAKELVDDRIYDERDLEGLVNAPVLSEIPPLTTPIEIIQGTRRVRLEWMSAASMLLVVATGFVFTYYHG